jgi:DNA-binding beta-propeller fold protein YncE
MWVTNYGSNKVTELSSAGVVLGTYIVGNDPCGVAFDGASVWVANQSVSSPNGTVSKL